MFDYLIVGAGFAGSVLAERLAAGSDKKVLIVDKRPHIGGNAHDCHDHPRLPIHKYRAPILHPNTKDSFRNYTRKQWGLDPSELDAQVTARVPVRTNRDDRYFTDTYQAMPLHGFTRMFEKMLAHPNIKVLLNCDYREVRSVIPHRELIYT